MSYSRRRTLTNCYKAQLLAILLTNPSVGLYVRTNVQGYSAAVQKLECKKGSG